MVARRHSVFLQSGQTIYIYIITNFRLRSGIDMRHCMKSSFSPLKVPVGWRHRPVVRDRAGHLSFTSTMADIVISLHNPPHRVQLFFPHITRRLCPSVTTSHP